MTLLEILLEELEKWSEHAASAHQPQIDKEIYFLADGTEFRFTDGNYQSKHYACVRGPEGQVTRDEFLEAQQAKKKSLKEGFLPLSVLRPHLRTRAFCALLL